jgi:hypothetical protein
MIHPEWLGPGCRFQGSAHQDAKRRPVISPDYRTATLQPEIRQGEQNDQDWNCAPVMGRRIVSKFGLVHLHGFR